MKPNFTNEPMLINGKRTFASVLDEYWDEVSQRWNLNTQTAYSRDYEDLILPRFRTQPLEHFDHVSQFDDVIEEIRQGGTRRYGKDSEYSSSTLRHFRHLMRRVVKSAAAHGICEDVLWGTIYVDEENNDPDKAVVEEKTRLHKSLVPEEEYDLAEEIFSDPLQAGEKMVALLGWAHGTRPQESAAVNWGHILPLSDHSDKYVLAVLTTVDGDGTKLGGKTNNRVCKAISRAEYRDAWCIYFEWRDIEGCGSAYCRMYNTIGGHPYKKPIYRQNALKYEEIEYLIDLIIDTLPEPD